MTVTRALGYPLLFFLGVLVSAAGTLVQAGWFPLGLLLALGGAVALFWGGGQAAQGKLGAALPAAGWAATVLFLTTTRTEGDFLFGAGIGSYLYLFGGMAAAATCLALAPVGRPMFDMTGKVPLGGSGAAARPSSATRSPRSSRSFRGNRR